MTPSFRKMGAANLLSGEFGTPKVFAHYFCVLWKIGFILGAALPMFDPPYNPFGNPYRNVARAQNPHQNC